MTTIDILYIVTFVFSAGMGLIMLPRIVKIAIEKNIMDTPDERRVHKTPTPRLGGVAFLPVIMMSVFLFNILCVHFLGARVMARDTEVFMKFQTAGIGAFMLYMVGVADDLVGVDFKMKFLAQIVAASLLPLSGLSLQYIPQMLGLGTPPVAVDFAITIFMVVYIINAINLIDGVDGLASGICIMTLVLYSVLFQYLRHSLMVATCLGILGVLTVFFIFNIFGGKGHRQEKIFMGDTGSLTLGYFISFLLLFLASYRSVRAMGFIGIFYMGVSPLVVPLLDIIRVVWARFRDRTPLFHPDKRHIHHKLLRTGLGAHGTMVTMLLLTLMFIGLNVLLPLYLKSRWVVMINILVWVVMHLVINYFIRREAVRNPELAERFYNPNNTIAPGKLFEL